MESSLVTSWQIDGETMERVTDFIFGAPKLLRMVTTTMKFKKKKQKNKTKKKHSFPGRKAMTN